MVSVFVETTGCGVEKVPALNKVPVVAPMLLLAPLPATMKPPWTVPDPVNVKVRPAASVFVAE
jgi:hypothetical protein